MMHVSPRQVHLDFHTSELIPDIAADFSARQFAETVREAGVTSMTVFARCHHGWLYYDSGKYPERVHPQLKNRGLLPEQVRALHAVGVRAPVYITVQWDYFTAKNHPEWLIRKADGAHEGGSFLEPGFYQSLCVNTGYGEFLASHTAEVCELLGDELDGIFFDIVGIRPCLCAACRREMEKTGVDMTDGEAVRRFAALSINRFKEKMSALVRSYKPDATIFYNAGHIGPCTRASRDAYSHFELESLPSGSWGYLHFPVTARYARTLGLDCVGMTGKFHTEWGDFHSLKNQAALEFECFRMLSYGFAASIGDQMEPGGALNPATYRLIGRVFSQMREREEWARPSSPLVEAALVTPEPVYYEQAIPESIFGACQLLEELALQFDVIDPQADFSPYRLLILPDDLTVSQKFQERLEAYVGSGGKVLALAEGGLNEDREYPGCFGVSYRGKTESYPDFIVARGALAAGLEEGNRYVIYRQGVQAVAMAAEPILQALPPYFKREGTRFCSHRYTPCGKGEEYPVAFYTGSVLLFTHPLFTQYRENAPRWCKQLLSNAIDLLLKERLVRHDGPSTLSVSALHQPEKRRVNLHLLSYIPVRKSARIDIIEEPTAIHGLCVTCRLPEPIAAARMVPENIPLKVEGDRVIIPRMEGYAILELSY